MARSVTIKTGKTNVLLPNGGTYDAGDVVILSDAEFLALSAAAKSTLVTDGGIVAGVEDAVITQAATVAAPAAQTSVASADVPTKVEFDKTVADITALRTTLAATLTALKGTGKPMASA